MTEEQIKEALRLASAAAGISYEFGYSRCGPDTAGRFEQQIACADSALEAYLRTIGTEPVQSVNAELMVALKAARVFMQHAESCGDSPSYNHEPDACGCGAEHAIDFVESAIARAESAIETPAKVSPCAGHAAQLPDPLGLLSCTHPDCGRYEGPRSHECRAMADNACARPSICQGHAAQQDADASRDWPEDFPHENGQYMNTCYLCKNTFIGHKRRVVCKVCSDRLPKPAKQDRRKKGGTT